MCPCLAVPVPADLWALQHRGEDRAVGDPVDGEVGIRVGSSVGDPVGGEDGTREGGSEGDPVGGTVGPSN